jgi:hypothetical protein
MTTSSIAVNTSRKEFQTRREEPSQRNITQIREAYFCRVGKNISTIAIPVIAMVVLANLPVANANRFTDCIDSCDRIAEGALAKMICYAICAVGSLL